MAGTFTGYEAVSEKDFDLSAQVTIEAWVRGARSGATAGRIVDKSAHADGYVLEILPQGKVRFITSKAETCDAAIVFSPDRRTYLAGIYDSAQKVMKLYADGKPVASVDKGNFLPLFHSAMPLRIGADQLGDHAFTGTIERVAISDRAFSADQIARRNADSKTPVEGVLGEWSFNGHTDQTARPELGSVSLHLAPTPSTFAGSAEAPPSPMCLWYRRPAVAWTEASPIGNGRLGAMVFGRVERERIGLNEDTFWSGQPHDYSNPDALAELPLARQLIADGKYADADRLISAKMLGNPRGQCQYQPIGDLSIDLPGGAVVSDYRRDLNIDTAIASTRYISGGVRFTREVFSSPVDQVLVMRLTADRPGQITFTARLRTPQKATLSTEGNYALILQGIGPTGRNGIAGLLPFACLARVVPEGGSLTATDGAITLAGADSATLILDAGTGYKNYEDITADPLAGPRRRVAAAAVKSFEAIRSDHIAEHQRLFRRVSFDLGTTSAAQQPADERRVNFAGGADDPQLAALYYQFGRYLLISSSRPGGQPANLQGIWNESVQPPWDSKFTVNINTEENYWPAEITNLPELTEPLFAAIKDLSISGHRTAKTMFNARGWVCFHNFDLWRGTAPIDGVGGYSPTCGAWLTTHLWEHYRFSGDKKFLADAYPIMRGAAEFFLDSLVEDSTHRWLVTSPTTSPEHVHPPGNTRSCEGSTFDESVIRDLFSQTAQAGELLGVDEPLRKQLDAARSRLAPFQVGQAGQIQEWLADWDMQASDLQHRHLSHLYGLFPSNQITVRGTPELAKAAEKTLNIRGDVTTGWAIAWRINCWARLHDGDRAYKIVKLLLDPTRTYPNFFDAHPPFQIDGNFAGTAGLTEMLLQSQNGEIELLPALPRAWANGKITGLRARGGFEVDIEWANHTLKTATIRSATGGRAVVRYGEKTATVEVAPNRAVVADAELSVR